MMHNLSAQFHTNEIKTDYKMAANVLQTTLKNLIKNKTKTWQPRYTTFQFNSDLLTD